MEKNNVNNQSTNEEFAYLFERNPLKRVGTKISRGFKNKIKNIKFPLGKFIFLGVLAAFIITIIILVKINAVDVPQREPYDKTGFVSYESGELTNKDVVLSNDRFEFHFDETTTQFYLKDKTTGNLWHSNVQEEDNFSGISQSSKNNQHNIINVYYHTKIGTVNGLQGYNYSISRGQFSVRYDHEENSIEVLYGIGNLSIDFSDLPQRIAKERFEELIVANVTDILNNRIVKNAYSYVPQQGVYVLKNAENFSENMVNTLHEIIFVEAGYTKEDMEFDHQENGVVMEDTKPYFEIAVKYKLTDKGFEATIINDSIYEKPHFPLVYIDFLPNFGTASTNDSGYLFLPDGSGALINLNNGKTHTRAYQQRIYGNDQAKVQRQMVEEVETVNNPIYGMKKNDGAFLAIIKKGAPMATILADISEKYDSYNRVYSRFNYRELDNLSIASATQEYILNMWTKFYNTSDYVIEYQFTEDEHSYVGMSQLYREYLIDNGLEQKDTTTSPVLNLSMLGGYEVTEHFLGIPYASVRSLTTTDQIKELIEQLQADGIDELNVAYIGWMNNGIFHEFPSKIKFDKAVGTKKDFEQLMKFAEENEVTIYPEVQLLQVNGNSKFSSRKDSVRDISGEIVRHYPFNQATMLPDRTQTPTYILNPYSYHKMVNKFIKAYEKIGYSNVSLSDFTSHVNGTYKNQNFAFRDDSLSLQVKELKRLDEQMNIMARNPLDFALPYVENIVDLSVRSSDYYIIDHYVPFIQLTLSGLIDYAGKPFNIDDSHSINWHKMKAIESGSNLNFTWSYDDTYDLMNTRYNRYYSTFYQNWYEDAIDMYQELNELGIYESHVVDHKILSNNVRLVTYANGIEIVLNYGLNNYYYNGIVVEPNNYVKVKGAK